MLIDGNGELAIGAAGASFDLAAGMLQWVAGDITVLGTLTNAGDMQVLDDNGGQTFKSVVGGLTLLNTGTMTWNFTGSLDGGYFSTDSISQVVNQGTVQWLNGLLAGNFSDGTNGTFSLSGSDSKTIGGNSTFTNLGVIDQNGSGSLCSGAGGSIGITTGNVNNQKGATYNLETAGTVQMGDGTFNNSGTFVYSATGTGNISGTAFNLTGGTVDVNAGTLSWNAATTSTGGTIDVVQGADLGHGFALEGVGDLRRNLHRCRSRHAHLGFVYRGRLSRHHV